MDSQSSSHYEEESKLKILMMQNQQLYKDRAENVLQKLQAFFKDNTPVELLQNVHLDQAVNYIIEYADKLRETPLYVFGDEQKIDQEIRNQEQLQNEKLLQEIESLNNQINQLSNTKTRYELAQRETANKILESEQIILNHKLNLDLTLKSIKAYEKSPCFFFAYDELADGSIEFKKSYKDTLNHYFRRVSDNSAIIEKLQKSIKETIWKGEQQNTKLQQFKLKQQQWRKTVDSISKLKQDIQEAKQHLVATIKQKTQQVQARLPGQIDEQIKELSARNSSYERAYHSIVQIVKQVIDNADIDKVTDYIQQP